jgi:D-3-phosphoglycerate dehydrogenase / 2-oxoglutarate reductase
MKIIVADDLPASALELLKADGWIVDARTGRTPDALAADLADADGLLVRSATRVDARLLAAARQLRIVARAGTGVDNVDVESASARGILVVNAAGANSISVAEHACALMLALARAIPSADRAMKEGRWEKKQFVGTELRGKTLGIAGFGRIGQEVARRARAFGMQVLAHDPFISADLAARSGVELVSLDDLCAADYVTLHLPSTDETHHLFNDERFARCKPGLRLINTARGELVDEHALRRAIERGIVAGAGLDVFEQEPPSDWALAQLPQVIATPHIAASTEEAQELVGIETAVTVRNFLRDGIVRNAVNFPSVHPEELQRLQPWIRLADLLGAMASQMGVARIEAISVRYYGALAESRAVELLASSAAAGVLRPILSDREVSIVNARAVARQRGIDIVESRSARPRHFTSLVSLKLTTSSGERWVEGTIFEPHSQRLVSVRGVSVEAPLSGTMLVIANDDQPGVIGEVGTILGRHGVNIASFALGRGEAGAIGVVNVDAHKSPPQALDAAVEAIRRVPAVREAWVIRL